MMRYLAGVLTVIAAGVLLVAYGLLSPRAEASFGPDPYQSQYPFSRQPAPYESGTQVAPSYGGPNAPMQVRAPLPVTVAQPVRAVGTIDMAQAPARQVVRRTVVEQTPRRDWKKTALVIGGSSATGAGVGAIFGGRKGALIGAAIGGGASTIYETTRR